ncbi:hypothetical protein BC567DRAFT_215250 [Phyllosticta citribraziliensis]
MSWGRACQGRGPGMVEVSDIATGRSGDGVSSSSNFPFLTTWCSASLSDSLPRLFASALLLAMIILSSACSSWTAAAGGMASAAPSASTGLSDCAVVGCAAAFFLSHSWRVS